MPKPDAPMEGPVQPKFSVPPGEWPKDPEAGDRVLLRWFLQMTPAQRLAYLQQAIGSLSQIRNDATGS